MSNFDLPGWADNFGSLGELGELHNFGHFPELKKSRNL
jgi:hypothetical protein